MKEVNVIAIDIAKNVFHLVFFNSEGKALSQKKLRRNQLMEFLSNHKVVTVVMEACGSSHHWGRSFIGLGHRVALLPPQHVKAYLRGQKNDFNDAKAIGEAFYHGHVRSVPVKNIEQQDEQSFHRLRKQWMQLRGDIVRQMRSLLAENGIALSTGITAFKRTIPLILEDAENSLSVRMRSLLHRQYERFLEVNDECTWYDQELKRHVEKDDVCQRLIELPGFGVVVASAFKNWVGDGQQFKCGRDASAALGVIPRQHSSGDKTRLMGITKRGNKELRSLVIHGARSVLIHAHKKSDALSQWINTLVARRGKNRATVALANKLIRMAWVLVAKNERYQSRNVSVSCAIESHT
jgi:transposase